jgi:glycosyltransferase involved in cell wall biosynthesis
MKLMKLAEKLIVKDRLTITGVVSRELVTEYISSFDIALQPAVVPYASPLKLFEYLVMEKAIIAPASENILEILKDGYNAKLFDPGSANSFRDALDSLVNNENLRKILGKNAKHTVLARGLSWEQNAKRVCQEIEAQHKLTDKTAI